MNTLFIYNAEVEGKSTDILIEGCEIKAMAPTGQLIAPADARRMNATGKAAFPTFVNCHTHAAMTLFRGYGDDLPLQQWLTTKIWPNEAHLDEEIIYWGTRLACLEMIKSGTTCFNDMYFFPRQVAQAVRDSGIRALVCPTTIGDDTTRLHATFDELECLMAENHPAAEGDLQVEYAAGPHAIYTVGDTTLRWINDYAREHDMLLHIHLSETESEVANCIQAHGCTPTLHLEKLGLLHERTIAAHSLWLSDDDVRALGSHGVHVCHNPNSNLKLGSGHQFRYSELRAAGANLCLGTDGCSSSNNLDMIEAAKVMALLQKGWRRDTTVLPTPELLQTVTRNGARALRLNAGELQPGRWADLMLVDLDNLAFVPNNDTLSNLFYAAHGDCVDTVICGGRLVMEHRHVAGEEEVRAQARRLVKRLITV